MGQLFKAVGAMVKQESEDNSPSNFDVLKGNVSMTGVPIGRGGRIILGLAAGQCTGVATRALHPEVRSRLGGVAFLGVSSVSSTVKRFTFGDGYNGAVEGHVMRLMTRRSG